jgi:prevent-host-death family protein
MNVSATDVKNRFGEFMDKAQKEPITVEKTGRRYAVLISYEEYERLTALEDSIWGERAREAEKSGFISREEADKLMDTLSTLP